MIGTYLGAAIGEPHGASATVASMAQDAQAVSAAGHLATFGSVIMAQDSQTAGVNQAEIYDTDGFVHCQAFPLHNVRSNVERRRFAA